MRCPKCGAKWQYKPQSKPVYIDGPLYHVTPRANRASIYAEGLLRQTEGVYLDNDPKRWINIMGPGNDVWRVDVTGLGLYDELDGLIYPGDIPPERLHRLSKEEL